MRELAVPRTGHPWPLVRGVLDLLVAVARPHPADPPEAVRPPLPDRLPVHGSDPTRGEVYLIESAAGYKRLVRCPCLLDGRCRGRDQAVVDAIPDGPPVLCRTVRPGRSS